MVANLPAKNKKEDKMKRLIDMNFDEIHKECGISSSHWRTLKAKAAGDAENFDYLIKDYKIKIAKKKERIAKREKPIPASEYDGYVLSRDEFNLAIYDYIPIAIESLTKKKYYLQNSSSIGSLEDIREDVYFELAHKVRKTIYEKYLDNVLLWKGYKQLVYRTTENLITDRIKKANREGNMVSLENIYTSEIGAPFNVGDMIRNRSSEYEILYIKEFIDRCRDKKVGNISLYDIVAKLLYDTKDNGTELKLKDVCKEFNLSIETVKRAFEDIGIREMLG